MVDRLELDLNVFTRLDQSSQRRFVNQMRRSLNRLENVNIRFPIGASTRQSLDQIRNTIARINREATRDPPRPNLRRGLDIAKDTLSIEKQITAERRRNIRRAGRRTRNAARAEVTRQRGLVEDAGFRDLNAGEIGGLSRSNRAAAERRTIQRLKAIDNQQRAATTTAGQLGATTANTIKRFAGYAIAARLVSGLSDATGRAIVSTISFQRELNKIAQLTSTSDFAVQNVLSGTLNQLSATQGLPVENFTEAAKTLAQAGKSLGEIRTILTSIAPTALTATFGDLESSTESVLALLRQFRLEATQTTEVLDSLNAVSKNFNVSIDELFTGLRQSGAAFSALSGTEVGFSEDNLQSLREFEALFTSVISLTRESASTVGTSLRTIFPRLQRSSTQNTIRDILGIDLTGADGDFIGPFQAIERITRRISELKIGTQSQDFSRLVEAIGGLRQFSRTSALLTNFEAATKALTIAQRSAGSVAEDNAKAQQTLEVQIARVAEEFRALVRELGESGALRQFADLLISSARAASVLAEALLPLAPVIAGITAALAVRTGAQFLGGFRRNLPVNPLGLGFRPPGFQTGGEVPIVATPGEILLNRSSARRIGMSKLTSINQGIIPGTGNSDNVPVLAEPGGFVIKKSSSRKLLRRGGGGTIPGTGFQVGGVIEGAGRAGFANFFGTVQKLSQDFEKAGGASQDFTRIVNNATRSTRDFPAALEVIKSRINRILPVVPGGGTSSGSLGAALSAAGVTVANTGDVLRPQGDRKPQENIESQIDRLAIDRQVRATINNVEEGSRAPRRVAIGPGPGTGRNIGVGQISTTSRLTDTDIDRIAESNSIRNRVRRTAGRARGLAGRIPPLRGQGLGRGALVAAGIGAAGLTLQNTDSAIGSGLAAGAAGAGAGALFGAQFGHGGIAAGAVIGGVTGFVSAMEKKTSDLERIEFDKISESVNKAADLAELNRVGSGAQGAAGTAARRDVNTTGVGGNFFSNTFDTEVIGARIQDALDNAANNASFATLGFGSLLFDQGPRGRRSNTEQLRQRRQTEGVELARVQAQPRIDRFSQLASQQIRSRQSQLEGTISSQELDEIAANLFEGSSRSQRIDFATQSTSFRNASQLQDNDFVNKAAEEQIRASIIALNSAENAQLKYNNSLNASIAAITDFKDVIDTTNAQLSNLEFNNQVRGQNLDNIRTRLGGGLDIRAAQTQNIFRDTRGRSRAEIAGAVADISGRTGLNDNVRFQELGDLAEAGVILRNQLPRILAQQNTTVSSSNESVGSAISTALDSGILNGLSPSVRRLVERQAENFDNANPETSLGTALQQGIDGVVDGLATGVEKEATEVFSRATDIINSEAQNTAKALNDFAVGLDELRQRTARFNDTQNRISDLQENINNPLTSGRIDVVQVGERLLQRAFSGVNNPADFANPGGGIDFNRIQERIQELQTARPSSPEEAVSNKAEFLALTAALKELGDDTTVLAEVNKKLAQIEQDRQQAEKRLSGFIGDRAGVRRENRLQAAFSQIEAGNTNAFVRRQDSTSFQRFAEEQIARIARTDPDRAQELRQRVGENIINRGRSIGLNEESLQQQVQDIRSAGRGELQNQANVAGNQQLNAIQTQNEIFADNLQDFSTTLSDNNKVFIDEIRNIFSGDNPLATSLNNFTETVENGVRLQIDGAPTITVNFPQAQFLQGVTPLVQNMVSNMVEEALEQRVGVNEP